MTTSPAQADATPTVSVVVPTYRRPEMLVGCLRALHGQTHPPIEILVSYRADDTATSEALAALGPEHKALVREVLLESGENLATGLNAGIAASRGEFVALTDDDSEAPADWIARLIAAFDDPTIGGVGGRDLMSHETGKSPIVGKVQWFGRRISNHQTGYGEARDVDVLKGVNCCFRGDLLRELGIDARLRGLGNVAHWELAICLPMLRAGWRLVYDPNITLTHHVYPRMDGDVNQRGGFEPKALRNIVHNETLMVIEHLKLPGKLAFLGWSLLIGTHFTPGVLAAIRTGLKQGNPGIMIRRAWATLLGRAQGLASWALTNPSRHARSAPHRANREGAA